MDAGEGRVHQCLRDNLEKLSDGCRKEELALRSAQASNVELMPNLAQACAPERTKHCADVRPGKARVFMCLLNKSDRVSAPHHAGFRRLLWDALGQQRVRRSAAEARLSSLLIKYAASVADAHFLTWHWLYCQQCSTLADPSLTG